MTDAEVILWSRLRRNALEGRHFRRQHPVGPFIADFACISARLIVEIDGATHATYSERAYDSRRERYLNGRGWRVLRVTNADVFDHLESVLDAIYRTMPPPRPMAGPPPPAGEEYQSARPEGE